MKATKLSSGEPFGIISFHPFPPCVKRLFIIYKGQLTNLWGQHFIPLALTSLHQSAVRLLPGMAGQGKLAAIAGVVNLARRCHKGIALIAKMPLL